MMRNLHSPLGRLVLAGIAAAPFTSGAAAADSQAPSPVAAPAPDSTTPTTVPWELLRATPGGLTSQQVGQRAVQTSFAAKQSLETLHAAQARVDAAWGAYLPRLTGTARYVRLSAFTEPNITIGTPPAAITIPGAALAPSILNTYLLQATLAVPISDYFLRINQACSAASASSEAAAYDLKTAKATTFANARVAYYTWLQMRAAVVLAVQSLEDQRNHLKDANQQFGVGFASKADVLRAQTAVASAEVTVVTAQNQAELAETQMRIALHAPAGQKLLPGEALDDQPPAVQGPLARLVEQGVTTRYEVKSILKNAEAARKLARVQQAARYPSLSAFGDVIDADPNPRRFPQEDKLFPTWDLGVLLTWTPTDIVTANGNGRDYQSRAAALEAQAEVTREGITIEVTQAWQGVQQSDFALGATARELDSATEAHRVARDLFTTGRGTSTTLSDALGELTRARIDSLNAHVNARVARVRLEHAIGDDQIDR